MVNVRFNPGMRPDLSSISIIVPIYNCATRLPAHVEFLESISPKVRELIWVITESPDRSCEFARQAAARLGGRVLEWPRGLYGAWNAGIAAANGSFIYFSTIGDFFIRSDGLSLLHRLLEKTGADVAISPPQIHPPSRKHKKIAAHWPLFFYSNFLRRYAGRPIPRQAALLIQILSGASGLSGSAASCLFRASAMKGRPFPTRFHHYGDTAWLYQYLPEIDLAYWPESLARFWIHDSETRRIIDKQQIYMLTLEAALHLREQKQVDWVRDMVAASIEIDRVRDPHPKYGWWLYPKAWGQRIKRERSRFYLQSCLEKDFSRLPLS